MDLPSPEAGLQAMFEGDGRAPLEREVLPAYLARQRWFAGKARGLESTRIVDATVTGGLGGSAHLVWVEVSYRTGAPDLYLLTIAAASGALADRLNCEAPGLVLTRIEGVGLLTDALADDGACRSFLEAIGQGRTIPTRLGRVIAVPAPGFEKARGPDGLELSVRRGSAEQSNSAILFGDRLILKVFRRLEPGTNPDLEIGRFLGERSQFDRIPALAGSLEYQRPGAEPSTLAILQGFVRNQGTGWEHALAELAHYFNRVAQRSDPASFTLMRDHTLLELAALEPPPLVLETVGAYLKAAAILGRRTAELHRALASDPVDPAFRPEPLGVADLDAMAREIRHQVETSLAALESNLDRLPPASLTMARRVLESVPGLLGLLDELPMIRPDSVRIRCHGDYHLGQVLRTEDDFVVLDFEGEPARPLEWRRRKQSPLRDVVGMLRSFDYAAFAALFAATDRTEDLTRLTPWARAWQAWNSAAFLRSYRATAAGSPFFPEDRGASEALLAALLLDKALYELHYELNNRPDWVGIPLRGILSLIESGRAASSR